MLSQSRFRARPYGLYLALEFVMALLLGVIQTTAIVYWVESGHFNPLQLVLLGTVLEAAYFVLQLPTGVLADLISRRLLVITGILLVAVSSVVRGASTAFGVQVVSMLLLAVGAAAMDGALEAWIAGELGEATMTRTYVRATQVGMAGTVVGSLLSGVIAAVALNLPMLAGDSAMIVVGCALIVVMPETGFQREGAAEGLVTAVRRAPGQFRRQTASSARVMRAVPGLVLLFAMTFFLGMWSESFDRLWGDFLLKDVTFPHGFKATFWFSILACAVAVLALGPTELAHRRTERLGPHSVVSTLLAVTAVTGAFVVLMALAHSFYLAIGAYLAVSAVRSVYDPLVSGWIVRRVDPRVSATALSARDMFDSGGQILGGPIVGVVGLFASVRAALLTGAASLLPAVLLLLTATRRARVLPRGVPGPGSTPGPGDVPAALAEPS